MADERMRKAVALMVETQYELPALREVARAAQDALDQWDLNGDFYPNELRGALDRLRLAPLPPESDGDG
jgi:hypothetical protein